MTYIKEFTLLTGKDLLQPITGSISEAVAESSIRNGIAVVETSAAAAGILKVSGKGEEVFADIIKEMRRIVPARINFQNQDSPESAAGSIKSALFGSSLSLIVKDGKLLCEGKQEICFADYDGPQNRTYSVCVTGGE